MASPVSNFWLNLSITIAALTLFYLTTTIYLLYRVHWCYDRLSIVIVIVFLSSYTVNTILSFLLTFLAADLDPSSPGFINNLVAEEGHRYLQILQSWIFFFILAIYAFKMRDVYNHFICDA